MDINRLIAAAEEIDKACSEREGYNRRLSKLAAKARTEGRSLTHEISPPIVFDMGDLIKELRSALHSNSAA